MRSRPFVRPRPFVIPLVLPRPFVRPFVRPPRLVSPLVRPDTFVRPFVRPRSPFVRPLSPLVLPVFDPARLPRATPFVSPFLAADFEAGLPGPFGVGSSGVVAPLKSSCAISWVAMRLRLSSSSSIDLSGSNFTPQFAQIVASGGTRTSQIGHGNGRRGPFANRGLNCCVRDRSMITNLSGAARPRELGEAWNCRFISHPAEFSATILFRLRPRPIDPSRLSTRVRPKGGRGPAMVRAWLDSVHHQGARRWADRFRSG